MTSTDGLLSIGQFARATGLTAKALRHYDAVGLLTPAVVEAGNGYRRYHVEQVATARLVRRLRELELPVAEVEAEDAQMIHAAHASTYHWMQIGGPERRARGEWQCSRVYCVLGQPEPAMFHAKKVLEICQREGIGDFDLAFAYEGLARACAVAGDFDEAHRWAELARSAATDIAGDFDRELLFGDLETLPAGV